MKLYVVAKGYAPGIYFSHDVARPAYEGFRNHRYESFTDPTEALIYILSEGQIGKNVYPMGLQYPYSDQMVEILAKLRVCNPNTAISRDFILRYVFNAITDSIK